LLRHGDDVVEEAHVEHPVGFVQHQRVECVELQAFPFQVVHHTPRRADDDVRAMLQRRELAAQGHAAAQGHDLDVVVGASEAADFGGDLVGQLPRGAQHQRLHREAACVQVGQQGQGKSGGLAAAGLGLGDDVFAQQGRRQARRLDRRHRQVAQAFQVGQGGGVEGEGRKGRCGGGAHPPMISH
jgi:hypothetical protein